MPADEVRVVYRKYDGALHWHQTMRLLGSDGHGVWLGAEPGIRARRGHEPPITIPQAHVMLFPRGVWWTAVFNSRHVGDGVAPQDLTTTEVYCDITTPPGWPTTDEVTMLDLDLDVVRRYDGTVEVHDEDEFAEHRVRYGYPPDVVGNATAAAAWLAAALADRLEPFGTAYHRWLGELLPGHDSPARRPDAVT